MFTRLQQIEVVSIAGRMHVLPPVSPSAANSCVDITVYQAIVVQKTFSIFPFEGMLQPTDTCRLWFEYLTETE